MPLPRSIVESDRPTKHPHPQHRCILICQDRSCSRNGSAEILVAFQAAKVPGVMANGSACMGQCSSGPTVRVLPDGTWYCRVKSTDVPVIVKQHLEAGQPVEKLLHPRFHPRFDTYS